MSDTETQDSDTPLENASFDKVIAALDLAASDAKSSGDFLSYSTVLDIYLSNPTRYTYAEREQLLSHVLRVLSADSALVQEIGWDIPSLVIPYIDSSFDMRQPIRKAPCIYTVIKIFEVLATHGNAKELFLKATEVLSTLRIDPEMDRANAVKFYDVKLYCLFELITSCLRCIHTMYPLRFLGMTVTAFINNIHLNPVDTMDEASFVWRRVYTFVRNYTRPPMPEEPGMTPEELLRVSKDEDYLQRKLLTAFLTECVSMVLQRRMLGCAAGYFNLLHAPEKECRYDFVLDIPVMDRMYELAQALDMDLDAQFDAFVVSSEELVMGILLDGKKDENGKELKEEKKTKEEETDQKETTGSSKVKQKAKEPLDSTTNSRETISTLTVTGDAVGDLFEALVVDYQKVFAHTLVDTAANAVTDSLTGILALYTYEVVARQNFSVKISLNQAIAIGLRLIVPGLVHSGFRCRGLHDISVFWAWYALQTAPSQKSVEIQLATVPAVVLRSYFQAILFLMLTSLPELYFRYVCLTMLTRLLCLSPEAVCYDFIIDSLRECPYESIKVALVGVLKELVTQDRTDTDTDIASAMKKVALDAPPLPLRDVVKRTKYLSLDESRMADLLDIVDGFVAGAFGNVNPNTLATLLAALNLLVLLRRSGLVMPVDATRIADDVSHNIADFESEWTDDNPQAMLNAVRVLGVTADRLRE